MKQLVLSAVLLVDGGQPPSAPSADSPGGYRAKKDRGAGFQTPLCKKAKLSHLARSSALRPVPHIYNRAILVNIWLSYLAKYAPAGGQNLFWSEVFYGA